MHKHTKLRQAFRSADQGGPVGGSAAPAVSGTLEEKLQAAVSERDAARAEIAGLAAAHDQSAAQIAALTSERDAAQAQVSTLTTERDAVIAERDAAVQTNTATAEALAAANANVARLEALCDLRGIEKTAAIPAAEPAQSSAETREALLEQLNAATDPVQRNVIAKKLRAV